MIEILLCVAYAVIYGLVAYLFILALQWLLAQIPGLAPLPAEALSVIKGIIAVLIFIMLLLCIFGGGSHRWDLFHFHDQLRSP